MGFLIRIFTSLLKSMYKLLLAINFIWIGLFSFSQNPYGYADPTFNQFDQGRKFGTGPELGGIVTAVRVLSDSSVLVGGSFTKFDDKSIKGLVKLKPNGQIDHSFLASGITNGSGFVFTIFEQPDGKLLIGGNFQSFNGVNVNNIIRLNADGSTDLSFNSGTGFNSQIAKIEMTNTGKILCIGDFTVYNGQQVKSSVMLNQDGSRFSGFSSNYSINGGWTDFKIQSDNKIVLVGTTSLYYNNIPSNGVARILPNGEWDTTFHCGSGFSGGAKAVDIDNLGRILIVGAFNSYNSVNYTNNIRLNIDGTVDMSYAHMAPSNVTDVLYSPLSASIYIFSNSGVIKLDSNGVYGGVGLSGLAGQLTGHLRDESLYLFGNYVKMGPYGKRCISKWDLNLNLDFDFGVVHGFNDVVRKIVIDGQGASYVIGNFTFYDNVPVDGLAKLDPNGNLDSTFQFSCLDPSGLTGVVNDIVLVNDTTILIVGKFSYINGYSIPNIAKLKPTGELDLQFNSGNSGPNSYGTCITLQNDGKLLFGGDFTQYNGINRKRIVRLNADGTADPSFNPGNGFDSRPTKVLIQPDGKLLCIGYFNTYNGVTSKFLTRINTNGSIDPGFFAPVGVASQTPFDIDLQSDNKIIVSGVFTYFNDTMVNSIFRLNVNGTRDYSFATFGGSNLGIRQTIIRNDSIYIVGGFQYIAGNYSRGIARLLPNGSYDSSFGRMITGPDSIITAFAFLPGNKMLIGGEFSKYDGLRKNRIAKINTCVPVLIQDSINTCTSFTWINNYTYTSDTSNVFFATQSQTNSCDTLHKLNLNLLNSPVSHIQIDTCASQYYWIALDSVLTESGIFTASLQNQFGCDSTISLNLNLFQPSYDTISEAACNEFLWTLNGQIYTTSGQYSDTIQNAVGCDSIVVLNLSILPIYSDTTLVTTCDSYFWSQTGQNYFSSGYYSDSLLTISGCDSIVTLNLTITHPSASSETQTACGSFTWSVNGQVYTTSGQYVDTIPNAVGCDSIITLDLTIIPDLPLVIENTFSMPSDANACVGKVAVTVSGNAAFELDIDNGSQTITSNGYSLITNLCPGIHDLHVTDHCGDTLLTQFVIPVDSNYVFNNPFIDSLAIDSLGVTVTNCDIYYAGIDTAYIDSIWANGNTVNVIWNIVDSNGSNFDTTSYVLNNGNGVYWLQLSVFCPNKSTGQYFAVTEAIYFNNGSVSTAGLADYKQNVFEVYPNPTNNQVRINFSGSDAELTVYDLQGKIVLKDNIQNHETISFENFERGVYLFDLRSSNGKSIQRVVKQ